MNACMYYVYVYGCVYVWLVGWLNDWLIGWLVDWLIDWLINWQILVSFQEESLRYGSYADRLATFSDDADKETLARRGFFSGMYVFVRYV